MAQSTILIKPTVNYPLRLTHCFKNSIMMTSVGRASKPDGELQGTLLKLRRVIA